MPLKPESRKAARKQKLDNRKRAAASLARKVECGYRPFVNPKTRAAGWPEPEYEPAFTIYQNRGAMLRWLGYSSYKKYLASPLWLEIRQRVLLRDQGMCRGHGCCCVATECHHDSYARDVLEGINIEPVRSACRRCHTIWEFSQNGVKLGLNKRPDLY